MAIGSLALSSWVPAQRLATLLTQETAWQELSFLGVATLMALAGALATSLPSARTKPDRWLFGLAALAVLAIPLVWWVLGPLLPRLAEGLPALTTWPRVLTWLSLLNLALIGPAAFCLGANAAAQWHARDSAGLRVLAGLIVGASAGTLTTLVLLPRLGTPQTLAIGVALAASIHLGESIVRRRGQIVAAGTLALSLIALLVVPADLLARGLGRRFGPLLAFADSAKGISFVTDEPDRGRLLRAADARPLAAAAMRHDDRLRTHLPLLLHPAPRDLLLLGSGSGQTLRAASAHPEVSTTLAPDDPARLEFHPFFDKGTPVPFSVAPPDLLGHPAAAGSFDVIVLDSPTPTAPAFDAAFSDPALRAIAAALRPGGIFATSVDITALPDDELRQVLAKIATRFPHLAVWSFDAAYRWTIVASTAPLGPTLARLRQAWQQPPLAAQMQQARRPTPFHLLAGFVMAGPQLAHFLETGTPPVDEGSVAARLSRLPTTEFGFAGASADERMVAVLGAESLHRRTFGRLFERIQYTETKREDVVAELRFPAKGGLSAADIREILALLRRR
jgi:spermidine synthase